MLTGTPWVSTSYTAERSRDRSTTIQLRLARVVTLEVDANPDLLVAVADLVGQPEDAPQIDVPLDRGFDRGQGDPAGSRDVGHPRGEAGGQGVQEELHGSRAGSCPTSTSGWSASYLETAVDQFLAGTGETVDGGLGCGCR